ncbi:MAG: crossover junction endodeoxyribonuclease RuvC [Chlorobi bacterium]|nr:crossover junction endodeoxyribonuclease RuvC [Chlorobiota bacterium]
MVVLGIDPGSICTGYGLIRKDRDGFHVLDSGVIRMSRRKSHAERIGQVYRELETVIDACRPTCAVLETVFLSRNVQSALKLGQVRGAVIALCANRGLELTEYAPREVKAAVTGRGAASKEQVAGMVNRMLQVAENPETYDVTDALGLALCYILKSGNGSVPSQRTTGKRKSWAQFVESRPDMIVH